MYVVTKQSTFRYHGDLHSSMWLLSSQRFVTMETSTNVCGYKVVNGSLPWKPVSVNW